MFTASVAGQRRNTVRAARWNAAPIKRGFVSWSMSSMGLFLPLLVLIWATSRIISLAFASPAMQPHRRAEPCTCDSLDLRCQHGPERPRGREYLTMFWSAQTLRSNWNGLHQQGGKIEPSTVSWLMKVGRNGKNKVIQRNTEEKTDWMCQHSKKDL